MWSNFRSLLRLLLRGNCKQLKRTRSTKRIWCSKCLKHSFHWATCLNSDGAEVNKITCESICKEEENPDRTSRCRCQTRINLERETSDWRGAPSNHWSGLVGLLAEGTKNIGHVLANLGHGLVRRQERTNEITRQRFCWFLDNCITRLASRSKDMKLKFSRNSDAGAELFGRVQHRR